MCQTTRAIRSGAGRNRAAAAFMVTLLTSFSWNARFNSLVLWLGSVIRSSAPAQVNPARLESTVSRFPA